MRAYPQKQTLIILAVCILAVGGVAFYVSHTKNSQSVQTMVVSGDPLVISTATTSPVLSTGDWRAQFQVYSTSSLAFKAPAAQSGDTSDPDANTATYKLGQSFLTQYIVLRQNGLTNDPQSISNAMNSVISQTSSAIEGPKLYTAKQIRTVPDAAQNIQTYGASLVKIYAQYAARQDEADIAAQALENGDPKSLVRVEPLIQGYKSMTAQLVALPVPTSLQTYHLDLVNNVSILQFCTNAFRHMDTDPYTAMAAIRASALATRDADTLFEGITSYLISQGVTINP